MTPPEIPKFPANHRNL